MSYSFDSVKKPALERITGHYGIPELTYLYHQDAVHRVICGTNPTDVFEVKTGVKQGCLLSPRFFTFCIDCIMTETIKSKRTIISWTISEMLKI